MEQELFELEHDELKRKRENMLFRSNCAKLQQNRHSLENICDDAKVYPYYFENIDYRKSMPNLKCFQTSDSKNYKPYMNEGNCFLVLGTKQPYDEDVSVMKYERKITTPRKCIPKYVAQNPPYYSSVPNTNSSIKSLFKQHDDDKYRMYVSNDL